MGISQRTERSLVFGGQLKDRKELYSTLYIKMLMLGLKATIGQLAITNSIHWCGYLLKRTVCHVIRRALDIDVEGQRKKRG